jgi:hypothetical protein
VQNPPQLPAYGVHTSRCNLIGLRM